MSKLKNFNKPFFYWAVGLSVVGCFLLITSLFLPPKGTIDPTVISGAGSLFVFSGSIVGLKGSLDNKMLKFESELSERMQRQREKDEEQNENEKVDAV